MKQCLVKEMKLVFRQKNFIKLVLLFAITYSIVGAGICYVGRQMPFEENNLLFYYMYVYPIAFVPFMLQFYPIAKDISESSNGGIENLLCTPCTLFHIIMGKVFCLCGTLMAPPVTMIIIMGVLSQKWFMTCGALLIVTPILFLGVSMLHICSGLKSRFQESHSMANFISLIIMIFLTYLPMAIEKTTGHVLNYKISIIFSILLALVIFITGLKKSKTINIETII